MRTGARLYFEKWSRLIDASHTAFETWIKAEQSGSQDSESLREVATQQHNEMIVAFREYKRAQAAEKLEEVEDALWNPHTTLSGDREFAQMQALAGWHHVPEIAPRESVRMLQAKAVIGAAVCMSLN